MLSGIIIDAVDPGIFRFDNDDDSAVPEPASGTPPSPEDDSPAMVVVVCSGSMMFCFVLLSFLFSLSLPLAVSFAQNSILGRLCYGFQ